MYGCLINKPAGIKPLFSELETPISPPTRTESLTFVNRFSLVGGLLGLEFVKREDINDANTFFTGYARIYTSTNCPDNLPGIIISFNINGVVVQFFFSGWPRRLYARMYWDAWNSWIKIADL